MTDNLLTERQRNALTRMSQAMVDSSLKMAELNRVMHEACQAFNAPNVQALMGMLTAIDDWDGKLWPALLDDPNDEETD